MSEKLAAGEDFSLSATTWNEIIDAKTDYLRRKATTTRSTSSYPTSIKIKNTTGTALRQGEIVEFSGNVLADEYIKQDFFWLKGVTPDETHVGFGIATLPIGVDEIGPVKTSGTCMGLVNVTDTMHKYAKISAGSAVLQSDDSGPVRIDYSPGQGEQACIVTIAPTFKNQSTIYFTLIEPLFPGGEANAFQNTLVAGEWVPIGEQIKVVDSHALWRGLLGYSGVAFRRDDNKYEIVFMQRNDLMVAFQLNVDRGPFPFMVCKQLYTFQHGNIAPPSPVDGFITVHDPMFLFKYALKDALGYAIYNDREDRYEAIACQQRCVLARAIINETGGMGEGNIGNVVSIANFVPASPSPFNLAPNPPPTEALNLHRHRGKYQGDILLAWDEFSENWIVVDVLKYDLNVVSDIRVNDAKTKVQGKVITIAAEFSDNPSDPSKWVDKLDLRNC